MARFWLAPTLLWMGAGNGALLALAIAGMAAAALLTANVWPRATIAACFVLFLSFVAAARDFAAYQSDGMLLEAAFLAFFLAPRGLWPGLGADRPPSVASLFLLRWEWFRIYFESGIVKLASGDEQWRSLSAMDHYYENGPLPTWIGWYAHQLPHGFHAATAFATLAVELGVVWLAWLPRPFRLATFAVTTALQVGIIATANYAFLNYLVLVLGFLWLDDRLLARLRLEPRALPAEPSPRTVRRFRTASAAIGLSAFFYATLVTFPLRPLSRLPAVLTLPARLLEPFRIANGYGLFAVMTRERYEIELQGTRDGTTWVPYPFRYKAQDPARAPGIYAPYQPRFDWNLWFASLGRWEDNPWIVTAEARLLQNDPDVLELFARNPFPDRPPIAVRAVLWRYGFTDAATRRRTGAWWWRREIGPYAPAVRQGEEGMTMEGAEAGGR